MWFVLVLVLAVGLAHEGHAHGATEPATVRFRPRVV
jgi:hypothetical protein